MSARRIIMWAIGAIVALAGCAYGVHWWRWAQWHVTTDDAYAHAATTRIASRIEGTISEVPIDDNWKVGKGDLLVRLDPEPYRIALQQKEADLAEARQTAKQARANLEAARSRLNAATSELEQARREYSRAKKLNATQVLSREHLDEARTDYETARARLAEAKQNVEEAQARLGMPDDSPLDQNPGVRRAIAARDEAALRLSWTEIRAPRDGVAGNVVVHVGEHVSPGQSMMALVAIDAAYVTANFNETDLTDVRVGQPVTIVADIYPDTVFHGHVDSLAPGTGAAFSLLPPENATGNWVKVVQRVPVKIVLDGAPPQAKPLRVGVSVEATIDTHERGGPFLLPMTQQRVQGAS